MVITQNSIRLSDEEATKLATALLAVVERRAALISIEPSMAKWNDGAAVLDTESGAISFSVCEE